MVNEQSGFFGEEDDNLSFFDEAVNASVEDDDEDTGMFGENASVAGESKNVAKSNTESNEQRKAPRQPVETVVKNETPKNVETDDEPKWDEPNFIDEFSNDSRISETKNSETSRNTSQNSGNSESFENRKPKTFTSPVSTVRMNASDISKVIEILDLYRSFDDDTRDNVVAMITQGEGAESEGDFIAQSLSADSLLGPTMTALKELKEEKIHRRGIAMLRLDDDVFDSVAALTYVFVDDDDIEGADKLDRADRLVENIEKLTPDVVKYVKSAESVLNAGRRS